jgi:hypothetical protein
MLKWVHLSRLSKNHHDTAKFLTYTYAYKCQYIFLLVTCVYVVIGSEDDVLLFKSIF